MKNLGLQWPLAWPGAANMGWRLTRQALEPNGRAF
jgi:hypothetical protein